VQTVQVSLVWKFFGVLLRRHDVNLLFTVEIIGLFPFDNDAIGC
jgi:hypothetical protein